MLTTKSPQICGLFCGYRACANSDVDADCVIRFEFVGYRAVADTGNHCGQFVTLLDEIFLADGVEEALTNGYFTEFDAFAVGVLSHSG